MPSTLTPTCSRCGLRYANRPLLELHIREDHPSRNRRAEPDHHDSGHAPGAQPSAGAPSREHGPGPRPTRTTSEVIAMTATRRPRRPRPGSAMTILHRTIRALRYVNGELVRASEALFRRAGARQSRRQADVPAGKHAHCASTTERSDQGPFRS